MSIATLIERTFMEVEQVTQEEFALWKRHPCTVELQQELVSAALMALTTTLPNSIDQSIPLMHKREGAIEVIDQIFDFTPACLREAL